MKEKSGTIRYTIRGVPPDVDHKLRKKAARRKQSLNQVILDELAKATVGQTPKASFSNLVGTWTADPEFDEIVAAIDRPS
jgi:hypothetical protein